MKKMMSGLIIVMICGMLNIVFAQVPQKINFQGMLNTSGSPYNGDIDMTFSIYNSSTVSTALWTETQTVTVINGIYNVQLGTVNPIDTELTESQPYWLGVIVGNDTEMTPRTEITPGLYPLILMNLITVNAGNIGINNENPIAKIDIQADEPDKFAGVFRSSDAATRVWLGIENRHDDEVQDYAIWAEGPRNYFNGDVGIGTTTPAYAMLDVQTDVPDKFAGVFRSSDANTRVWLGIENRDGDEAQDYAIWADGARNYFNGNVGIGITAPQYKLHVAGTLKVNGADFAEPFDMSDIMTLEKADVVVIDPVNPLHVMKSTRAYDTTVAGIVSSTEQAGYIAGERSDGSSDKPVALVGRVFCKVSTENGTIQIGDLLTTSATPGHAMKATDFERRQGAILGKALQSFNGETGQIMVLVTLQ